MVSTNPNQPRRTSTLEAQDHVLRAVDELRALGGEVRITVGGKPVGRFIPLDETSDAAAIAEAVEFIERFGEGHSLGNGLDWKALRDEGRR